MNLEAFILDALENIGQFDFNFAIRLLLFALGVIWIFTTYWVWKDSEERIENVFIRILITLLVLPFNFIALIAYLLSRPKDTFESAYWGDLEKRYLQYETTDMGDCENCGYDLQPGFLYCPVCSHPIKAQCQACGEMIDRYWNFCPYCSAQQREFIEEVSPAEEEIATTEADVIIDHNVEREEQIQPERAIIQESEEPEVTNEPQPEFGLDDIEKKPEVQKSRPEKEVVGFVRPPWREIRGEEDTPSKVGVSIPTELGKAVLSGAAAVGKGINELFSGIAEKVKSLADMEVKDELVDDEIAEDVVEIEEEPVEEVKEEVQEEKKETHQDNNSNKKSKKNRKKKNKKRNKKRSRN